MKIETLSFFVDRLKLMGEVYFPETPSPHPALCLCHGIPAAPYNPETLDPLGYPVLARKFSEVGFVTLIFNFRGTGRSEGNLDILGWAEDLARALDLLSSFREVNQKEISVFGFSAGAAVAIYVAAQDRRVARVISGACPAEFDFLFQTASVTEVIKRFRNIGIIRDTNFPPSLSEWLKGFDQISPVRWISRISPRPILILHGDKDEVVPLTQAQRLYEAAGKPKEMIVIPGAGHRLRLEAKAIDTALAWLLAQIDRK